MKGENSIMTTKLFSLIYLKALHPHRVTDKTSSLTYPLVVVSDACCHADLHHLWWVFFTVFCHDEMTIHTREIFYCSHEEHLTSSRGLPLLLSLLSGQTSKIIINNNIEKTVAWISCHFTLMQNVNDIVALKCHCVSLNSV